MTGRTTAEIVAALRASIAEPRLGRDRTPHERVCAEAADRLTELDAYTRMCQALAESRDALRPTCPTCGGARVVKRESYGEFYDPCPDCVDGKVSIEQLAATWRAVWDDANIEIDGTYNGMDADYLRAVRP